MCNVSGDANHGNRIISYPEKGIAATGKIPPIFYSYTRSRVQEFPAKDTRWLHSCNGASEDFVKSALCFFWARILLSTFFSPLNKGTRSLVRKINHGGLIRLPGL